MTIQEYIKRYGTCGLNVLLAEVMNRSPEFQGRRELFAEIGQHMRDLRSALEDVADNT